MTYAKSFVSAVVCLLSVATVAEAGNSDDWVLVARAELILVGKIVVDSRHVEDQRGATQIGISEIRSLRGSLPSGRLSIGYNAFSPETLRHLETLSGSTAIVFLNHLPPNYPDLYPSDDARVSIRPFSPALEESIRSLQAENDRNYALARKKMRCDQNELSSTVGSLIDDFNRGKVARNTAVARLVKLGTPALFPLICELERQRSPLGAGGIAVEQSSAPYEKYAQYLPEQKVDVLDVVLSEITGVSFVSLANGASDEDRARTIKGWWTYAGRMIDGNHTSKPAPPR